MMCAAHAPNAEQSREVLFKLLLILTRIILTAHV